MVIAGMVVLHPYDGPNTAHQQPLIVLDVALIHRYTGDPQVAKRRLVSVLIRVQSHGDLVDDRIRSLFPNPRLHLFRLVWPHVVISQRLLDVFHAPFNDHRIRAVGILPQQEFQHISRDVRPLFDLLRQILAHEAPGEKSLQLVQQVCLHIFCRLLLSNGFRWHRHVAVTLRSQLFFLLLVIRCQSRNPL